MDKKWLYGIITSLLVIPTLILGRDTISSVFAAPAKVEAIENKLDKQSETQEEITLALQSISQQQQVQQAVSAAQIEAVKEQISYLAELKKKSR